MALLIICPGEDVTPWRDRFLELAPSLDLRIWPETGAPDEIDLALVWNHPPGELLRFEKLGCIASMGAGVDRILSDPELPRDVPITRVVDASLVHSMTDYVILAVLNHYREMTHYRECQRQSLWAPRFPRPKEEVGIGIMGLGQLGADAAARLRDLRFTVSGWSRTRRDLSGVRSFFGDEQLKRFLSQTDVLICLLPLTPRTEGILNRETFRDLRAGAFVINVARGKHLVEEDLLAALETGHLSGACLDVFREEPLPPEHPFWSHSRIQITPHASSLTEPQAVAPQVLENYRRLLAGEPLLHLVNRERGY